MTPLDGRRYIAVHVITEDMEPSLGASSTRCEVKLFLEDGPDLVEKGLALLCPSLVISRIIEHHRGIDHDQLLNHVDFCRLDSITYVEVRVT
jgi:hypothetical protein